MARAFEVILHRGVTGKIYNIGGTHEKANIEVAKDLIRLMGHGKEEEKMLQFVEDRAFNGRLSEMRVPRRYRMADITEAGGCSGPCCPGRRTRPCIPSLIPIRFLFSRFAIHGEQRSPQAVGLAGDCVVGGRTAQNGGVVQAAHGPVWEH